jgi:hypothetical protein
MGLHGHRVLFVFEHLACGWFSNVHTVLALPTEHVRRRFCGRPRQAYHRSVVAFRRLGHSSDMVVHSNCYEYVKNIYMILCYVF